MSNEQMWKKNRAKALNIFELIYIAVTITAVYSMTFAVASLFANQCYWKVAASR